MALVVEDGSGKANAQCYRSAADTAAYHTARGNATFAALTDAAKEAAILQAQEYMRDNYGSDFGGYRVYIEQALDWPRAECPRQGYDGAYWPNNVVPALVADAESDLALKASQGPLLSDLKQGKKSVKVGPLSVEYDENSNRQTIYSAVAAKLQQFIIGYGSTTRIVRS